MPYRQVSANSVNSALRVTFGDARNVIALSSEYGGGVAT